jgi:hypothetical protein
LPSPMVSKFPPKSTLHIHYITVSYKAFNIKHKLPVWLMLHCRVNPTLPNTQSYINFPHDATHISSVANLKPSVYSGPSCTFFSLKIHRLNCR